MTDQTPDAAQLDAVGVHAVRQVWVRFNRQAGVSHELAGLGLYILRDLGVPGVALILQREQVATGKVGILTWQALGFGFVDVG